MLYGNFGPKDKVFLVEEESLFHSYSEYTVIECEIVSVINSTTATGKTKSLYKLCDVEHGILGHLVDDQMLFGTREEAEESVRTNDEETLQMVVDKFKARDFNNRIFDSKEFEIINAICDKYNLVPTLTFLPNDEEKPATGIAVSKVNLNGDVISW